MSGPDPNKDGGWIAGVIAEKERLERRDRLRLLGWGFCAVLAIGAAASLHRIPAGPERPGETARLEARTAQVEQAASENGLEARRLAAAIATLNSDRDRLFGRMASLETSLEAVRDSLRKIEASKAGAAATAPAAPLAAPVAAPADAIAAAPEAAEPPVETTAAIPPRTAAPAPPRIQAAPIPDARFDTEGAVETVAPQTEFGLELGKARSPDGLRALWRTLSRKHASELQGIGPMVVVRERRGGFDLHLVAGPIRDAATAARLCAALIDARQACRTTIFDGQRLSLTEEPAPEKGRRARRKSTRAAPPQAARPSPSIASMIGFQ